MVRLQTFAFFLFPWILGYFSIDTRQIVVLEKPMLAIFNEGFPVLTVQASFSRNIREFRDQNSTFYELGVWRTGKVSQSKALMF